MKGIEAMFDAMQRQEGLRPNDMSRQNRNPLNLTESVMPHTRDSTGKFCVFRDITDGTFAGILDIQLKVKGRSAAGLRPDSTLDDFFNVFAPAADHNQPNLYAINVAEYVTRACNRPITHISKLREVCPELFEVSLPEPSSDGKVR